MNAVWDGRSDGSSVEADSWVSRSVYGEGVLFLGGRGGGECGVPNCNKWEVVAYLCYSACHCDVNIAYPWRSDWTCLQLSIAVAN